jgi:1-acyl-sn-glycerol-3-phosphate acyltransferase
MPATESRSELDIWWRVGRLTVGALVRAALKIRAVGEVNLPRTGPALLAANHLSVLDAIVIGLVVSDRRRTVRFLAGAEFFKNPLLGWMLRKVGQIPIRRGTADRGALQMLGAVVREGSLAAIFPEGRMRDPDERVRGTKGVARIAITADVPIVPVGLWGTHRKWPRHAGLKLFPLRPLVVVCIGPAVPPEGDLASRADVRALTDRVMDEIGTLVEAAKERADR